MVEAIYLPELIKYFLLDLLSGPLSLIGEYELVHELLLICVALSSLGKYLNQFVLLLLCWRCCQFVRGCLC